MAGGIGLRPFRCLSRTPGHLLLPYSHDVEWGFAYLGTHSLTWVESLIG